MHNVIALRLLIFSINCHQSISLCTVKIIYNVKKLIYKRKYANLHHFHFVVIYKVLNVIIFIFYKFLINMSYLALISLDIC
jgi:hypothetical protein